MSLGDRRGCGRSRSSDPYKVSGEFPLELLCVEKHCQIECEGTLSDWISGREVWFTILLVVEHCASFEKLDCGSHAQSCITRAVVAGRVLIAEMLFHQGETSSISLQIGLEAAVFCCLLAILLLCPFTLQNVWYKSHIYLLHEHFGMWFRVRKTGDSTLRMIILQNSFSVF